MTRQRVMKGIGAAWVGLALLAGEAAGQTSTRMLYSANTTSGSVSVMRVSVDTGALTSVATITTPTPRAITVDHSGRFVYVASETGNRISAFSINATGGLVTLPNVTSTAPVAIVPEPTGRFVYASNGTSGAISIFAIRVDGSLASAGSLDVSQRGGALVAHPSGRFLYGLDPGSARLIGYSINSTTGALQAVSVPPTGGTSPAALVIEPRGRFLYVLHDLEDLLTVFSVNPSTGTLTSIQSLAVKNPTGAVVEGTGRFLFVASPKNDAVFAYTIDQSTGFLTFADTEVLVQPAPNSLSVDPTNRYVYATSPGAARITRLTFDPASGVMTEGASVAISGRPAALALAKPHERFLFTHGNPALNQNAVLAAFRTGAGDGALTLVDEVPLSDSAVEVALEASGRFAYVLNVNDHTIDVFGITLSTGEPTLLQTTTMPGSVGGTSGLAIDPTGRFLVIACICNSGLNARMRTFRISASTGLLTDLGTSGGDGNLFASTSTIDPTGRFAYVGNSNTGEIEAFALHQTSGMLTPVGTVASIGEVISQLAADPLRRFLFATTFQGTVRAFRINATTGALTAVNSVILNGGIKAASIDRTGRFLHAVTSPGGGGSVHVLTIDQATGALATSGNPAVPLGDNVAGESAAVDATGRFFYVGHGVPTVAGAKGVRTFAINPVTGAVTVASNVASSFPPRAIRTSGPVR